MPNDNAPRWLNADAASSYLSIRTDAFLRRVANGTIPAGSKGLGQRTPLWWSADLDAIVRGSADPASTNIREAAYAAAQAIIARGSRSRRPANAGGRNDERI